MRPITRRVIPGLQALPTAVDPENGTCREASGSEHRQARASSSRPRRGGQGTSIDVVRWYSRY
ncbi:hypothetical protein, partial [uncultured Microbacterium sp.]|uniref:hypothetical protein n=1 Tax=uncultured Microbacterium sp. TaxID=191216 RepID=UPI002621C6E0